MTEEKLKYNGDVQPAAKPGVDMWIECRDRYRDLIAKIWAPAGVEVRMPAGTVHMDPIAPTFAAVSRETYEALCRSVWKWWGVAFGNMPEISDTDCPLCALFLRSLRDAADCDGCPINESSARYCKGTPYGEWVVHGLELRFFGAWGGNVWRNGISSSPVAQRAAIAFYFWLQALRDEYREQLEAVEKHGGAS
jgi:hypothetical protein